MAPGAADPHAGHAGHSAPPTGRGAGATRLAALVEALLEDPAVRQRIQQDTELHQLWSDPAVRAQVAAAPAMADGMAKLLELVRSLTADPAVQWRIEADPALRELVERAGVRQRIQPAAHP